MEVECVGIGRADHDNCVARRTKMARVSKICVDVEIINMYKDQRASHVVRGREASPESWMKYRQARVNAGCIHALSLLKCPGGRLSGEKARTWDPRLWVSYRYYPG